MSSLRSQGCDFKTRTLLPCLKWVCVVPGRSPWLALSQMAQRSPRRAVWAIGTEVLCQQGLIAGYAVDVMLLYGTVCFAQMI